MFRVGNPTDDDGLASGAYSEDGGTSWSPARSQPAGITAGGSVAVNANGSSVVWSPGGTAVHYSTNDGGAWTASLGIPTGARVAADRVNPSVIYGYTGETTGGADDATLWVSFDAGASFSAAESGGGLPSTWGARIKAVPGHEGHVWLAGGEDGLWSSSDYGDTFVPSLSVEQADNLGFGKPAPGETFPAIFLQARVMGDRGLFRSDDAGMTFVKINDAAHQWAQAREAITGDPRVYGRVYLGTNGRGIVYGDCVGCDNGGVGGSGGTSGSGGTGGTSSTGGTGGTSGSGGTSGCFLVGDPCTADGDCCSNKCKGQPGAKTCR